MGTPKTTDILERLRARFDQNPGRHVGMTWSRVEAALSKRPAALKTLRAMEETGGEPDVIGDDQVTGTVIFCDCCAESPAGRRSLCYDRAALDARKANKPTGSVVETADAMGISLLTEDEYRHLQTLGVFDTKTSSWIRTPPDVRSLGGALFCDRRFGRVFVYHNGAESYYAARGFRGIVRV